MPTPIRTLLLSVPILLQPIPAARAAAAACAPDANQMQLDQCAGDRFQQADAALNTSYKTIMARLRAPDLAATRKALVTAQRAWIGFRDAECGFRAAGVSGGSIYPMIFTECRTDLTLDRVKALDSQLHCPEGDMACSVPPP